MVKTQQSTLQQLLLGSEGRMAHCHNTERYGKGESFSPCIWVQTCSPDTRVSKKTLTASKHGFHLFPRLSVAFPCPRDTSYKSASHANCDTPDTLACSLSFRVAGAVCPGEAKALDIARITALASSAARRDISMHFTHV